MSTDFSYGGKQIVSSGPFKPSGKDMPSDARTRVECYADIATIPNPHVGLKITVKVDETNNNKMTDYIVKSLKADSIGVANSLIDEVVRYVDYLGVNTGGGSGEGLTSEQAQHLQTAYLHSQTTHVQASDIPSKTSDLENDSGFLTSIPSEYITDSEMSSALSTKANKSDIPSLEGYATETFVTNKIAEASLSSGEVDLSGYATKDDLTSKVDKAEGKSLSTNDLTNELKSNYDKAYLHSQSTHVQSSDIPTKTSDLQNDSGFITSIPEEYITETELNAKGYLTSHQDISGLQPKTDNGLATTNKTVVGAINELKNGINSINVPNKVSELTNDSMYVTNSQLNELLNDSGITPPEIDSTLRWIVAPETLELTPGISKEITVTINDTVTRCPFRFGSNASILTFSGADLFSQTALVFANGETSKNITITANTTDRKIVDYLYFGKFNNNEYNVIQTKTKIIVNPSIETVGVESVSLSQNSLSINKGERATLTADISPAGATNKNVTWSANNSNVSLTPNALSCEILGSTAGSSVVTVTSEDGNKTASCNISINETQSPETYGNIVLSKTSETISENSTTTFTVKLDTPPTNNQTVSLSSNNSDVTLDKNSLIFTSSNYNEEQTVTITIAKDSDRDNDTCKITATSPNVSNVYLDLTITDVDTPPQPTGNVITDGLQVYLDGRDVEEGSTQAYWSNKVEGSSLSQIPIVGQFGTPNKEWNDITKRYGWLGDSFRYYLTNQHQGYNTIPNFDENTREFTIEIGFLKEQQKLFNSINVAFKITNPQSEKISNIHIAPNADGTVRTYCSVNGASTYTDTSTDTAVKHYAVTSNGDNTISVYDGAELLTTLTAQAGYPFVYPFSSFGIAKGGFTQNVRIYYLRIYNRKLTTEEMRNNYQYESSIERSIN